jgi:hypothetical protein
MEPANQSYWKEGIRSAMIDSRLISRWDLGFKRSILVQVQTVLRQKVHGFVPDLQEVDAELTKEEKEDEDEFDALWNEDIPLY